MKTMKRLTSNNYHEMDMVQLALNQVYLKDGWAWYVNGPECHISVCDLIRAAAEALNVDLPTLSDDELSELLTDWLQYGAEEPEGVLAVLYRALWAMAVVRSKLTQYEDTGLMPEAVADLQRAWDMYGGEVGITGILTENRELKEKRVPKCYSEDVGGGCRYLVLDGDDEPIDKCKRCPLCRADKHRHQSPPNAPLTLEELREMDGEPVWVEFPKCPEADGWMLVDVNRHCVYNGLLGECDFENYGKTWFAYRRKPDDEPLAQAELSTPSWAEHYQARFERLE